MIGLGAIWKELFRNLGRKPVTHMYPVVKSKRPENFRGKPVFDPKSCIGCQLCVRDCPSKAIKIDKIADKVFACSFFLDKCIFCGQCEDSCPKNAISMSHDFELACFDKSTLLDYKKGEPPATAPSVPK